MIAGGGTAAKPIGIAAGGDADRPAEVDRRVTASAFCRAMDGVGWSYTSNDGDHAACRPVGAACRARASWLAPNSSSPRTVVAFVRRGGRTRARRRRGPRRPRHNCRSVGARQHSSPASLQCTVGLADSASAKGQPGPVGHDDARSPHGAKRVKDRWNRLVLRSGSAAWVAPNDDCGRSATVAHIAGRGSFGRVDRNAGQATAG